MSRIGKSGRDSDYIPTGQRLERVPGLVHLLTGSSMCDVSARRVDSLGLPFLGYRYYSYWQMRRPEVRPGCHPDPTGV